MSKWKTVLAERVHQPCHLPLFTDSYTDLLAGMLMRMHLGYMETLFPFNFQGSKPGRASDTLPVTGILTMKHTKPTACLIISQFSLYAGSSPEPLPDAESFLHGSTHSFHFPAESQHPRGSSDLNLNETKDGPERRAARKQRLTSQKPLPRPRNPMGQGEG